MVVIQRYVARSFTTVVKTSMSVYFPESFMLEQLDIVLDWTILLGINLELSASRRGNYLPHGQAAEAEALRPHRHSLGPAMRAAG
jgi:hypothetical protein